MNIKKLSELHKAILRCLYKSPKALPNEMGEHITGLVWNVAIEYNAVVLFNDTEDTVISLEEEEKNKGFQWLDKWLHDRRERYRLGYVDSRFYASISRSLKRLEERGLIERKSSYDLVLKKDIKKGMSPEVVESDSGILQYYSDLSDEEKKRYCPVCKVKLRNGRCPICRRYKPRVVKFLRTKRVRLTKEGIECLSKL